MSETEIAEPMTAEQIAGEAARLIGGDRDRVHGNKITNFQNIALLWSAWLEMRGADFILTGADVAKLMTLLKIARMESGTHNVDDAVDACGYAAIAGELA